MVFVVLAYNQDRDFPAHFYSYKQLQGTIITYLCPIAR